MKEKLEELRELSCKLEFCGEDGTWYVCNALGNRLPNTLKRAIEEGYDCKTCPVCKKINEILKENE